MDRPCQEYDDDHVQKGRTKKLDSRDNPSGIEAIYEGCDDDLVNASRIPLLSPETNRKLVWLETVLRFNMVVLSQSCG